MIVTRITNLRRVAALITLAGFLLGPAAYADSGFYIGGGLGDANVETRDIGFDENDSAWKAFGGYIVDMPVIDFGVEAAFVELGNPSGTVLGEAYDMDVSAISAFGMVGLDYGLFGMFAKAGIVSWDADISIAGLQGSDSGSDSAYGLGFRLTFSSVEVRTEYEVFDIADIDTVDMLSLGVLWRF